MPATSPLAQVVNLGISLAVTACGLASQPSPGPALDLRVHTALVRSRPALFDHLAKNKDGQLALLVLAAIHDEVPFDNRVFQQALRDLARERLSGTYELAIRLMVMAELETYPNRTTAAREDTAMLLSHQCEDGGFSYTGGRGRMDLSNTQYGALGMRAAAALGQKIEIARWKQLLQLATSVQDSYGGFSYTTGGVPSASMTVAGIGILEIARQQLTAQSSMKAAEGRIARGWRWMDQHVASIGKPTEGWSPYFHYGLERAAILSDKESIGGKDWYALGAEMFIREQLPDGGWALSAGMMMPSTAKSQPVDTAFAILFLRKKFRKLAGPITQAGSTPVRNLTEQATDAEITHAVNYDALRAKQAVPELLLALRSKVLPQRKAAILALFKIAGDDFDYQPYVDPAKQETALERAETWWSTAQKVR